MWSLQLLQFLILFILYTLDVLISLIWFIFSILFVAPYIYLFKSKTVKSDKSVHVVIIGYSFAGFELHKNLQSHPSLAHYRFTIIEPKEYLEFTPCVLEALVKPSKYRSISFPLTKCFDTIRSVLIQGKAIGIDSEKNEVTVENVNIDSDKNESQRIHFDYCFICTGSKYAAPIKMNSYPNVSEEIYYKSRASVFEGIYSKLNDKLCKSIGVIGAGPVGVELMAEITEEFPTKQITILDMADTICAPFPRSTQKYLQKWIAKRPNVTLMLGAMIKDIITPSAEAKGNNNDKTVLTVSKGKDSEQTLEFDMVFRCAGFRPNSEILREEKRYEACLSERIQFIIVDEHMRVACEDNRNIFALGDVISQPRIKEVKLCHTAEIHALYMCDLMVHSERESETEYTTYHKWLLGRNIVDSIDDIEESDQWDMPLIFTISLGRDDGSMGFGNVLVNGWVSQLMKWFIETSLCKLYHRKGIFDLKSDEETLIFRLYPIGWRVFNALWILIHKFTIWYIRHFQKRLMVTD